MAPVHYRVEQGPDAVVGRRPCEGEVQRVGIARPDDRLQALQARVGAARDPGEVRRDAVDEAPDVRCRRANLGGERHG